MPRDLLGRPPLRVSELPPGLVRLFPGEARAVVCLECGRWQVPHDGGIRRHATDLDGVGECPGTGRRVWFDLTSAQWLAALGAAGRDAAPPRKPGTPHRPPAGSPAAAPGALTPH